MTDNVTEVLQRLNKFSINKEIYVSNEQVTEGTFFGVLATLFPYAILNKRGNATECCSPYRCGQYPAGRPDRRPAVTVMITA